MKARPNILLISCDQLSADALRVAGNRFANTPHIDALVARGTWFSRAFSNCPLCMPQRASFWTGRLPHQTGTLSNGGAFPALPVPESMPTAGSLLREAGYHGVHFGKMHDNNALHGFECIPCGEVPVEAEHPIFPLDRDTFIDRDTRLKATAFLRDYNGAQPWIAACEFNNPHNICSWVGRFQNRTPLPEWGGPWPDLPANWNLPDPEWAARPLPIQYLCCAHNRQAQAAEFDEAHIRAYLLAYHHYLSRVDAEVGAVLAALARRPDAGNTVVIFFADHGDAMCGRGLVTKHTSFYEETMRVPLLLAGPSIPAGATVDHLVSLLDLLPTLCDLTGVKPPDGLFGRSLLALAKDPQAAPPHDYVPAQWHTEWGHTIEPGRMIRTRDYKYIRYREGNGEEFYDLVADPGEMVNAISDARYAGEIARHRTLLERCLRESGDPFHELSWKADPRWRSHPPGPRHHRGPTAPQAAASQR